MSFYLNAGLDESRARIEGVSFSSHPEILVYIYIYVYTRISGGELKLAPSILALL